MRTRDGGVSSRWSGCGTALVTPFTADGAVDDTTVRRLTKRQVDAGVHFLAPCGTTGESPTLSRHEQRRVVELVVETADSQVPVLAGAGGYDTAGVIELVKEMDRAGADGVLSVTPYYNRPTPDGIYQHYQRLCDNTPLPIIVYNVPGRTGCNVDVETLGRLSELPNIVGVKEASGDMAQMCEVCRAMPDDFSVLSGDDLFTVPLISIGGTGVISVVSNEMPAEMAALVSAARDGDFDTARTWHSRLLPLMQINFIETNPIPVKAAMAHLGLLEPYYRLPMVPPQPKSLEQILRVLNQFDRAAPELP